MAIIFISCHGCLIQRYFSKCSGFVFWVGFVVVSLPCQAAVEEKKKKEKSRYQREREKKWGMCGTINHYKAPRRLHSIKCNSEKKKLLTPSDFKYFPARILVENTSVAFTF